MPDSRITPADHLDSYGRLWSVLGGSLLLLGLIWPTPSLAAGGFFFGWTWGWEAAISRTQPGVSILWFSAVAVGVVTIGVGCLARGRARARTTAIMGIALVASTIVSRAGLASVNFIILVAALASFLALFVGARLVTWFPASHQARLTAIVSGLLVLVASVLVLVAPNSTPVTTLVTGGPRHTMVYWVTALTLPFAGLAAIASALIDERLRAPLASIVIAAASGYVVGAIVLSTAGMMAAMQPLVMPPMMLASKVWLLACGGLLIPTCGVIEWTGRNIAGDHPLYEPFARATMERPAGPTVLCSGCSESVLLAHGRCNSCGRKIGDDTRRMLIAAQAAESRKGD